MTAAVWCHDVSISVGRLFDTTEEKKEMISGLLDGVGKARVCGTGGSGQKRYSCKRCNFIVMQAARQASQG